MAEPLSLPLNDLRFYPDDVPSFKFEPTRDRFVITGDDCFGEGVRSLRSFKPGNIVFRCTGFLTSEVTQFSLQLKEDLHLHDPYFYGKVLHSCDPNCRVDVETRCFIARKNIEPGDYVTMDYASTEDRLYRTFNCSCGAASCRGYVGGRKDGAARASTVPNRSAASSAQKA